MIDEPEARVILERGDTIANIGQLTPAALKMIRKNVRAGRVEQFRAPWCGMNMKTHFRLSRNYLGV